MTEAVYHDIEAASWGEIDAPGVTADGFAGDWHRDGADWIGIDVGFSLRGGAKMRAKSAVPLPPEEKI